MKLFSERCILLCVFGLGNYLWAQEPDSSSALKSMIEAERAFARMAVTHGVRDAFVENLSDDAIIFRPGPVKGRPVWQERKPLALMIRWEPEYVDIAASGDFGYSTGPAEYLSVKPLAPAIGYGYFISIWTKQADGKWKVALDIGTEAPKLENTDIKIHFPFGADVKKIFSQTNTETEKTSLIGFDEKCNKTYTKNKTVEAFLKNVAPEARFYREGKFPVSEIDSIKLLLSKMADIFWKPIDGAVAASGDMAYTYGSYKIQSEEKPEEGYYFRTWKRDNTEQWKIVIDVLSPVPPQK
ncbi:nuclear transport factor 2 family protein [bacterium]|nr:MAG: nuclear transport factor 2 family protein [bacterium]